MIKINLLPVEIGREKNIIQLIILISLIIIIVIGGMFYYYNKNVKIIEEKKAEKVKKESELASLQQVKKELEKQKNVEKRLKRKYEQIDKLNKKRVGPLKLLNVVAKSLHGSEMFTSVDGEIRTISAWLNSLDNSENTLILTGLALDYSEIANFMSTLQSHNEIKGVKLISSQKVVEQDNEFISFKLECQTRF
ncbi:PilN domain-containing protein [bacterium]|nr:PilN domain-containing protein [bacterium]